MKSGQTSMSVGDGIATAWIESKAERPRSGKGKNETGCDFLMAMADRYFMADLAGKTCRSIPDFANSTLC